MECHSTHCHYVCDTLVAIGKVKKCRRTWQSGGKVFYRRTFKDNFG